MTDRPSRPPRFFPLPLARLFGFASAFAAASCASLPDGYHKSVTTAFDDPSSTTVGRVFEREAARHPGQSGFAVLATNRAAFTDRAALADFAEKTLDVQYFIWSPDTIGKMLAGRLIDAAERGVRVRFLLDDVNFKKRDSAAAAIAAHPNIEVRIFNPHRSRSVRIFEFLADFGRLNKRMHNKIMVMDNAAAIVGGRNIADEYFGLGEKYNNRDLDIVAIGPVVREISATFDEFWNSPASIPIEVLAGGGSTIEDFKRQVAESRATGVRDRERYPYPLELDLEELRSRLLATGTRATWARAEVLYDELGSMRKDGEGEQLFDRLAAEYLAAENEILIESAYFVVRDPGIELTRQLSGRGVRVRVLTNSLASNNVLAAQAGHSKRRAELVDAGVELYELRPDAAAVLRQVAPHSAGATTTLHTKALVIDGKKAFVGSFNLDPRSADINSEIGILVHSPEFARQVQAFLDEGVREENAYRVRGQQHGRSPWDDWMRWDTEVDDEPKTYHRDPETSWFKRLKAGAIEFLPIDNQL